MVIKVTRGVGGQIAMHFLIFRNIIRGVRNNVLGIYYCITKKGFMFIEVLATYLSKSRVSCSNNTMKIK